MAVLKQKIKTTKLRSPYYELSDAANRLKSSVPSADAKLKALAQKAKDLSDSIYKHLEANYIWD